MRTRAQWIEDFQSRYLKECCCNGDGFIRTSAPRGHPLFGVAIPCICREDVIAQQKAQRLQRQSGITEIQMAQWSLDKFDPRLCKPRQGQVKAEAVKQMREVWAQCTAYAKNPKYWLILSGDVGTGKTHLAYGIAIDNIHRGKAVYAALVANMLDMLRGTFKQDMFESWFADLRELPLIILDDLGAQKETDWTVETLFKLLDYRHSNHLPVVITTNCRLDETCSLDLRMRSRIMDRQNTLLMLPCSDFRLRRE